MWDYIVVGAGSAGCVLANRLSSDPNVKVLLIEAGGWDWHPLIRLPLAWPVLLGRKIADWGYDTEIDKQIGRGMECARGKVIGGSSSTNAMAWVKGHPADYDRWDDAGLSGWDHHSLLTYFKKIEDWTGRNSGMRGTSGPLTVEPSDFSDPICDSFRETVHRLGHNLGTDYNSTDTLGFSPWQMTRANGRRASSASAYLHPVLSRPNLKVMVRTHATGLVFDGDRVVGLRCRRKGRDFSLRVSEEILLCGGAINSPQLLMLSGIGRADELEEHGISCRINLPGVGANLQDHISSSVICERSDRGTLINNLRIDRLAASMMNWVVSGAGIGSQLPVGDMGFLQIRNSTEQPDLQVIAVAGSLSAKPWLPLISEPRQDLFTLRAVVLHPESRGQIRLRSPDPFDKPLIEQNFLTANADRSLLRDGLRRLLEFTRTEPLSEHISSIVGPTAEDDNSLDDHIASTAISVHHPAGTCRMGDETDPGRVVDSSLRVVGVKGLRVVDASIMPDLTGGNINAPVMMIAEKAADMIGAQKGGSQ
ncbi:GMC family oxidoreductase N-terminal domain-containing protein [uncultured Tateyamaria sp.]|uniref:GMC family oxidoreductase n=1 Tax=uncultured Tateyamaria sp. TaxID=455651 RepID=UPI0026383FC0|nr:GMC family oxidoreductase N-terminal domain-containing protein [uncultured Tateyamaria sp.]